MSIITENVLFIYLFFSAALLYSREFVLSTRSCEFSNFTAVFFTSVQISYTGVKEARNPNDSSAAFLRAHAHDFSSYLSKMEGKWSSYPATYVYDLSLNVRRGITTKNKVVKEVPGIARDSYLIRDRNISIKCVLILGRATPTTDGTRQSRASMKVVLRNFLLLLLLVNSQSKFYCVKCL